MEVPQDIQNVHPLIPSKEAIFNMDPKVKTNIFVLFLQAWIIFHWNHGE